MIDPIPRPAYLTGTLSGRWDALAPQLRSIGALDALNADVLAKYILAENEYLRVSDMLQRALNASDADSACKWIAAQDKLTKQILLLSAELGLSPDSRRQKGFKSPR